MKAHKDHTDIATEIVTWQALDRDYREQGRDEAERIKRAMAHYEQIHGTRYFLLVGDSSMFPVRYFMFDECSRAVAKQLGRELTTSILVPGEVLQMPLGAEAVTRAMATKPGSKGGYLVNVENMFH